MNNEDLRLVLFNKQNESHRNEFILNMESEKCFPVLEC